MKLEYLLLGLFSMRPWSGYDLGKWFAGGGRFYRSNTDQSQIYRVLKRMEEAGWITHQVDPRDKRPDAKLYSIAEAGRAEFLRWVRTPFVPPSRFQDAEFLVRFVYGGAVDPDSLRHLLTTELEARRDQVARSRGRDRTQRYENPIPEIDVDRANFLLEASHVHGMHDIDDWIVWLEKMITDLDAAGITTPATP
jgi:DNA-binding PadR family transcriptional regulator